jgi:hypothetical protein
MSINLSTIRSNIGGSGPISFSQIRNLSTKGIGANISLNKVKNNPEYKGITQYNVGTPTEIINGTGNITDGMYWIEFNGTNRRTVCLLNPKWFGGGWIGLQQDSFPVTANANSSATWVDNNVNLFGLSSSVMPKILQVSVVEVDCGGNSYYAIAGTNTGGPTSNNVERLLLMNRVNTIGQCSRILNGTSMGYIDNPSTFSGENDYNTYSGVCRWGDNIWAEGSSYISPESGLKRNWIFRSRTNANNSTSFYWDTQCANSSGTHYHMWFFRENITAKVPTFMLTSGKTLLDPGSKESYATTSSNVIYNMTPVNIVDYNTINGSFTFNTSNSGIIRLNNTDGYSNTARLNLSSRTIQSVSIWFYVHARQASRYLLDAREVLGDGYIWHGGIGPGWSGSVIYINNMTSSIELTWDSIEVEGVWRCITIVRPSSFIGPLTLFSRYTNDEAYNVSFGPIYINDSVTSGYDHMLFYNQYSPRFNSVLLSGFTYHIYSGYYNDDVNWFYSRTEAYGIGLVTNMSNIVTSTNSVVPAADVWDQYSVEWIGYFYAPTTGSYTFYTVSDDASYLWIGSTALSGYTTGNCLVNNAGLHPMQERSGTITLTGGTYYPIRIQFGENYGGDNCVVSFAGPSISKTSDFNNYAFSSTGLHSLYPAENARTIKTITGTNNDGSYYINVNGTSTLTYCLMDSKWDGGGWMMMMKATTSTDTFNYDSSYWTDANTTLNPNDTNRNNGDAKFNTMNYMMVKDVMALWPDSGYTGGSIAQADVWSWLVNNFYGSGIRTTALVGFSSANNRDSSTAPDPLNFSGFSSSIWSTQSTRRHIMGGTGYLGGNLTVRWGFVWNNEGDFYSIDVMGGIGMGGTINYSAGDYYGCCGNSVGLNRRMRVELYGR